MNVEPHGAAPCEQHSNRDTIDVGTALDAGAGVPAGDVLLRFATAAHLDNADLPAARRAVRAAVGAAGLPRPA